MKFCFDGQYNKIDDMPMFGLEVDVLVADGAGICDLPVIMTVDVTHQGNFTFWANYCLVGIHLFHLVPVWQASRFDNKICVCSTECHLYRI